MIYYDKHVEDMTCIAKEVNHGPAPIPEEGQWVQSKEIKDISGLTHGVGWCAPQQGACKLTLNVKEGIIEEALVETVGCSGMTHSAAMAAEILPGKTILEALNTDLVCDAINTAMRELFLQIVYGRTQTAFSDNGLPVGAGLDDLGKGLRSQVGTLYSTKLKGPRYLELAEGYVTRLAIDAEDRVIGYEVVQLGKAMEAIKAAEHLDFYATDDNLNIASLAAASFIMVDKNYTIVQSIAQMYLMAASRNKKHLSIFISRTGENRMLVDMARTIRGKGDKILLITSVPESSLGKLADIVLPVATVKKLEELGPRVFLGGAKYVIDVLFASLAASCGLQHINSRDSWLKIHFQY